MVYGNLNRESGSGVAFSRRPGGFSSEPVGEYLTNAFGNEVLEGKRHPTSLDDLMIQSPALYQDLIRHMRLLESHDKSIEVGAVSCLGFVSLSDLLLFSISAVF
jgi:pyruvate,orthophosphate dikinase